MMFALPVVGIKLNHNFYFLLIHLQYSIKPFQSSCIQYTGISCTLFFLGLNFVVHTELDAFPVPALQSLGKLLLGSLALFLAWNPEILDVFTEEAVNGRHLLITPKFDTLPCHLSFLI